MATKKASAELRSKQQLTVDFFQIGEDAGGPEAFAASLESILNTNPNSRSRDIGKQAFTVYEIRRSGGHIEGEIGRLRATGAPFVGTKTGIRKALSMNADEFIAECTAFLFDTGTGVLAIHTTMEGVSASRLSAFCDSVAGNDGNEEFVLLPVLRPDTDQKLRRMTDFKKVEVRIATPSHTAPVDADQSTRSFVRGAKHLGGDNIQIVVGTERGFAHKLDADATRGLIRSARANSATRLVVSGSGNGDRSMTLDLIQDRLRERRSIEVRGRCSSYETRRKVVREAFEANLEVFENLERT